MAAVLPEAEVRRHLGSDLPQWEYQDKCIRRVFEFKDFAAAIKFVTRAAEAAEEANHHPDIDIRYNKVRMSLTSHDSGGVTNRDIRMARRIAELAV